MAESDFAEHRRIGLERPGFAWNRVRALIADAELAESAPAGSVVDELLRERRGKQQTRIAEVD